MKKVGGRYLVFYSCPDCLILINGWTSDFEKTWNLSISICFSESKESETASNSKEASKDIEKTEKEPATEAPTVANKNSSDTNEETEHTD